MEKEYRFIPSGYISVRAHSEAEAREKISGCIASTIRHGRMNGKELEFHEVFICVVPTALMDTVEDEITN